MPVVSDVASLCHDWRPYRPREGDKLTNKSAEEMLENNEARKVWGCDGLHPRPASS